MLACGVDRAGASVHRGARDQLRRRPDLAGRLVPAKARFGGSVLAGRLEASWEVDTDLPREMLEIGKKVTDAGCDVLIEEISEGCPIDDGCVSGER